MAEVTLIDISYQPAIALSTFTEVEPQFSNLDSRLGPVIEKAKKLSTSTLRYPRSISVTSAILMPWCKSMLQLGRCGSSSMLPHRRGYEIASETIFGQVWCFSEARRQSFTCANINLSCPLCCTKLISTYWSFTKLTSQPFADEDCETILVCLEEQKVAGRLGRVFYTVSSLLARFNTSPLYFGWEPCVGVCRTMALISNAKQATGEGKRWSSWNRTHWTSGYGPEERPDCQLFHTHVLGFLLHYKMASKTHGSTK